MLILNLHSFLVENICGFQEWADGTELCQTQHLSPPNCILPSASTDWSRRDTVLLQSEVAELCAVISWKGKMSSLTPFISVIDAHATRAILNFLKSARCGSIWPMKARLTSLEKTLFPMDSILIIFSRHACWKLLGPCTKEWLLAAYP